MKKIVALTLVAALCGVCGQAQAAKVWDDMSWWGNTGATPEPHPDSKGRSGYWWWPVEPASNAGDTELWGNRGIVYHAWERAMEEEVPAPDAPEAPAEITRQIPTFDNVLFDFDRSVVKPAGMEAVGSVATYMAEFPQDTVLIEGHTDSIGTEAYNMGLGQRRADAVATALESAGVSGTRISTQSFGEGSPVVANDTPANRALNRRAVFKITLGE